VHSKAEMAMEVMRSHLVQVTHSVYSIKIAQCKSSS